MPEQQTLLDKIWASHIVQPETPDTPGVLYIDLHLIHEGTSPQAFALLRSKGVRVRRPERTVASLDHTTPTILGGAFVDRPAEAQAEQLRANCKEFGVRLFDLGDEGRGIVHVIGPEQGLTQPGMTIVCGDSHTSTHGAFGALGFGIGTSEVAHVLATQCLLQRKPKSMVVRVDGRLQRGVSAKDVILAIIAKIGVGGGTGHAIEYAGSAIRAMSMEERMTVCNMTIEAGARAGMVAPDETTFQYLAERGVTGQPRLASDPDAKFDHEVSLEASTLEPMITWGTTPGMGMPIRGIVPESSAYMGLEAGKPLLGRAIDVVFIGSCTNARLSDLRAAASVMRGRRVQVRTLVVPGSQKVKRDAEAEGLDRVFKDAGAEWRESGCSMCIAMNGDQLQPGQYAVSTSNRNFEGRQGRGGRTFLASPMTAAAAAVTGTVSDVRELLPGHG